MNLNSWSEIYYNNNRLTRIEYQRQYNEKNKEKLREYQKEYWKRTYVKKEKKYGWDMPPYKLQKIESVLRKKLKELEDNFSHTPEALKRIITPPEPFSGIYVTKEGLFRLVF